MKLYLTIILMSLALKSQAQVSDSSKFVESKLYIGISFSTVSHNIYYDSHNAGSNAAIAHFAPLSVNIAYKLTERLSLQAGVAYGGSSDHVQWKNNDGTGNIDNYTKTNVLALPLTARYSFIKLFKRVPVYGLATVMPAYGTTKYEVTETKNNITTTVADESDSGMNTYFTAGVGLNYKIYNRFNGFFEYYAYKHNFNGSNSVYYDWDQGMQGIGKVIRSVGIGLNYNL